MDQIIPVVLSLKTEVQRLIKLHPEINDILSIDRRKSFKMFELVTAKHNNHGLWSDLHPTTLAKAQLQYRYQPFLPDRGIDTISLDMKSCGQAKYYAPDSYISHNDFSSFFTYAYMLGIKEKILTFSEGARFGFTGKLAVKKDLFMTVELSNEEIRRHINEALEYNPPEIPKEKVKLRYYQKDCVKAIMNKLSDDSDEIIHVLMPCGTGKSLVILATIKQLVKKSSADNPSIIFVPSVLLLNQFSRLFDKYAKNLTVGMVGGNNRLEFNINYDVILCVYNSSHRVKHIEFNTVFIDESHYIDHRFYSDSNRNTDTYIDKIMNITRNNTVMISATSREKRNITYSYSIEQAILDGYLADYAVIVPFIKNVDKHCISQSLVKLLSQNPHWGQTLAFTNTNESAINFCKLLNKAGISAEYITCDTSIATREMIIKDFKKFNIRVIVSCQTLKEGIDIPCAKTCMFVEPKKSEIDIIQKIGRVLRPHSSKSHAYIILPSSLENTELSEFIRKISDNDTRFRYPESCKGRLDVVRVTKTGESLETSMEIGNLIVNLYTRLGKIIKGDVEWYKIYDIYIKYITKYGTSPSRKHSKYIYLRNWILDQRKYYKRGKLSQSRIDSLNSIGFIWDVASKELLLAKYKTKRDRYDIFINTHHKEPKTTSDDLYESKIAKWALCQRRNYTKCILGKLRIILLEEINFKWVLRDKDTLDADYKLIVNDLDKFIKTHGIYPNSKGETQHERTLGSWCVKQRIQYFNKDILLTPQRIQWLNDIGFIWKPPRGESSLNEIWYEKRDIFIRYMNENNKIPSEKSSLETERKIGQWASDQRKLYHRGDLLEWRKDALDELGFKWKLR